ncbi:Thioredoxin, mitochondrial [Halotydeus destructor]|nr:Thioredoxin, mitochondrial [Halotydeus destructor]
MNSMAKSCVTAKTSFRQFKRTFTLSASRRDIFKIQGKFEFEEKVLKSKDPVIVDFYATWCGPCKLLMPKLETIVGGKNNKIHLAKVDTDEQEELAEKYKVKALPTVIAFKDGKVTDQFTGLRDDDQLRAFVEKLAGE